MAAHATPQAGRRRVSETVSPLWTAEQQGWLTALGHAVYVRGTLPETAVEVAPTPVVTAERAPASPQRTRPASSPASSPAPAPAPAREAAPTTRRPAARLPDRLHIALIRAAAINPNAPGMAELIAQWPASSELRGNPAAKRALWPRLRALRKGAPG